MEEISSLKRQREEVTQEREEEEIIKRQKSYKDIITLLEQEEDLPNEDLSSLISTLQEEISSPEPEPAHEPAWLGPYEANLGSSSSSSSEPGRSCDPLSGPGNEDVGESVMRHLLEASDDELGLLPNTNNSNITDGYDEVGGGHMDGGEFLWSFVGDEGIWEFEDHETVNNYSMFQQ